MPRPITALFFAAFVASSDSLLFSTALRAFVANWMFVFNVVFHPARNRAWICWSCANRASPTFSSASAYFSRACASWSSPAPDGFVCCRSCEPAIEARAIAWLNVFGCGFVDGAAVSACCASAGLDAWESSVTFSEMLRPRSVNDSRIFGG